MDGLSGHRRENDLIVPFQQSYQSISDTLIKLVTYVNIPYLILLSLKGVAEG